LALLTLTIYFISKAKGYSFGKPVHKGVDVMSMPLFSFIPYL
jgi:hypothetical protein